MDDAGIGNVTPHRFRRTVATVVNDAQGALLASELLGHTDPRITMQHYIQRNETVNPVTAQLLDEVFTRASRAWIDSTVYLGQLICGRSLLLEACRELPLSASHTLKQRVEQFDRCAV